MPFTPQVKEYDEKVIAIDRVARVVKGGRRFRFRATVVIGNGRGQVGVGVGKGGEVMTSIAKAVAKAKRSLITVSLHKATIPHEVEVRFAGARVLLKPASPGTGVIAGGAVRNVVEAAGIHDLLTKSLGSSNKVNNAYATILALTQLQNMPIRSMGSKSTKDAPAKSATKAEKTSKPGAVVTAAASKASKAVKPSSTSKTTKAKP
jgi:small subunit ribosomal protein S5